MRIFILAAIVLAGGLTVVPDAEAVLWRARSWSARDYNQSGYQYYRSARRGVYYDSGIAFERDWKYPRRSYRPTRVYYDSGIAFQRESTNPRRSYRPTRTYYDSGIAFDAGQDRPFRGSSSRLVCVEPVRQIR